MSQRNNTSSQPAGAVELRADQWSLLGSYAHGPHIWDATEVFNRVCELAALGLVRQTPGASNSYSFELTEAGRNALESRS